MVPVRKIKAAMDLDFIGDIVASRTVTLGHTSTRQLCRQRSKFRCVRLLLRRQRTAHGNLAMPCPSSRKKNKLSIGESMTYEIGLGFSMTYE